MAPTSGSGTPKGFCIVAAVSVLSRLDNPNGLGLGCEQWTGVVLVGSQGLK